MTSRVKVHVVAMYTFPYRMLAELSQDECFLRKSRQNIPRVNLSAIIIMEMLHLADEFPKSIDSRAKFIDFRRIHEFDTEFVKIVSH